MPILISDWPMRLAICATCTGPGAAVGKGCVGLAAAASAGAAPGEATAFAGKSCAKGLAPASAAAAGEGNCDPEVAAAADRLAEEEDVVAEEGLARVALAARLAAAALAALSFPDGPLLWPDCVGAPADEPRLADPNPLPRPLLVAPLFCVPPPGAAGP